MPIKMLLVEDNPADLQTMRDLLRKAGGRQVVLNHTGRLAAALETLNSDLPDVIVLDLSLPDSKGLVTFQRLQAKAVGVPIVVLTGIDDVEVAVQTIAQGASDYLLKDDLTGSLLVHALRYGIERKRMEVALRRTQWELEIKNKLAHIFLTVPDRQMFPEVLAVLLEATGSEHGMIGYIDVDGALVCPSMIPAWGPGQATGKPVRFPCETWGGVWGRSLREKRSLYSNEPGHVPEGHLRIRRVLIVPLLDKEEVIGIFVVANRPRDYEDKDQEFVERVAAYLAPVLHARLQRDAQEKALATALAGKELLLQEVHHRVKNNLQIISSILNMQAQSVPEEAQRALDDSQRRVRSMALVHEQLYSRDLPDELDFAEYASSLTADLLAAYSVDSQRVRLRLELDPVVLRADQATPCGLILNELVTNALKYAFPGARSGEILVAVHCRDGRVSVRVADTGIGLPPGFDLSQSNSLGLRIVDILTLQLNGTMDCPPGGGVDFTLTFPKLGGS